MTSTVGRTERRTAPVPGPTPCIASVARITREHARPIDRAHVVFVGNAPWPDQRREALTIRRASRSRAMQARRAQWRCRAARPTIAAGVACAVGLALASAAAGTGALAAASPGGSGGDDPDPDGGDPDGEAPGVLRDANPDDCGARYATRVGLLGTRDSSAVLS